MKHLYLLLTIVLISCGSSKTVRTSKKVIKGDWTLNSVTYTEVGNYQITLLDDVSKGCFEGSDWSFVPNNNTGTYNIDKASCDSGERYFIFTIQEMDSETGLYDFLLKPTDAKRKSKNNKGFRLQLTQLSDSNMQWKQSVLLEGQPFEINMNFSKR